VVGINEQLEMQKIRAQKQGASITGSASIPASTSTFPEPNKEEEKLLFEKIQDMQKVGQKRQELVNMKVQYIVMLDRFKEVVGT